MVNELSLFEKLLVLVSFLPLVAECIQRRGFTEVSDCFENML